MINKNEKQKEEKKKKKEKKIVNKRGERTHIYIYTYILI